MTRRSYQGVTKSGDSRTRLESLAAEGKSPVDEIAQISLWNSQVSRGISRVNLRGPPRKAKYFLTTDSGQVP